MSTRDQAIAVGLRRISDLLGEALANAQGPNGEQAQTDDLLAINEMVWQLRWEIRLFGGEMELAPETAAEAAE